jgi:hypothetical protein
VEPPHKAFRVARSATKWVAAALVVYLIAVYGHFLFNGMPYDPSASTYVTISPKDTDRFLEDLGAIANLHGLTPSRGSATPDNGRTLYVLEAAGRGLSIWSQNVPLSGNECAELPTMGPDPGQFAIYVLPAVWLPIRQRATELFSVVSRDLSNRGYHLSGKARVPCDPSRVIDVASVPTNPSLERP